MATKTVTLTGGELCVNELGGLNALIINNTTEVLYASAKAGVVPYADGVIEIQSGESQTLPDSNGTVFLLGSGGRAQLTGTVNFRQPSRRSGGGGGVTRAEVNSIVTDKIAEVVANAPEDFDTLKEIADWIDGHEDSAAAMNSEIKANAADISDILAEQQTQNFDITTLQTDMEQKADIGNVSNPNLLDNPDFKINQRGQIEYTAANSENYTVDRWIIWKQNNITTSGKIIYQAELGGVKLKSGGSPLDLYFRQKIENASEWAGKVFTLSFLASDIIGKWSVGQFAGSSDYTVKEGYNSYTFMWEETSSNNYSVQLFNRSGDAEMILKEIKLELGNKATSFVPPHPATELLKCQRYYQRLGETMYYCIGSGTITNSNVAMALCPLLTPMLNSKKTVNINGTLRIVATEHIGNSAIVCTGLSSGATVSQNSVILPLSIEPVGAELVGSGCIAQCRDNETYVEISADL